MRINYIDRNIKTIMQDPASVLYFRPYDVGKKRALFAIIKGEKGTYKKVQITEEQSKMEFPFEPIYWFFNGSGRFFQEQFMVFNNWLALNAANLDGFISKSLDEKNKWIGIFATFSDGSATFIQRETAKKFKKQNGIEPYEKLLKQYKECSQNFDTYEIIECYDSNNDSFVIPQFQEKQKIKALTNDDCK